MTEFADNISVNQSSCKQVICYANSSSTTGAGHIMRTLAIAQAFHDEGYQVTFLSKYCLPNLHAKIVQMGFYAVEENIDDVTQANIIALVKPKYLVIDDYFLTTQERSKLSEPNPYLTIILDDNIDEQALPGNIIVNPAPTATESSYRIRNPAAKLLLGPAYSYLRKEFKVARLNQACTRQSLLITLGGTDVLNISVALVEAIIKRCHVQDLRVVLGSATNKTTETLKRMEDDHRSLTVLSNVQNMAHLMAESRLAVSAAGGTLGELACMGVPTIALVSADNQVAALESDLDGTWYQAIDMRDFDRTLPCDTPTNSAYLLEITEKINNIWHNSCKLSEQSEFACQLIDAHGCQRIVTAALKLNG